MDPLFCQPAGVSFAVPFDQTLRLPFLFDLPLDLFFFSKKNTERLIYQHPNEKHQKKSGTTPLELYKNKEAQKAEQRNKSKARTGKKNTKKTKKKLSLSQKTTTSSSLYERSKLPAPSLIATSSLAFAAAADE